MSQTTKVKKKFLSSERIGRILPIVLVALGVSLMLFIVAPYEIYSTNKEEFKFVFSDFVLFSALYALALFTLISLVLFLLPRKAYLVVYAINCAFFLLLFLQTNFLNAGVNSLAADGTGELGISVFMKVLNTVIWIGLLVGFGIFAGLFKKVEITKTICLILSVALLSTQVINFASVALTSADGLSYMEQMLKEDPNYVPTFLTDKNLTTVSENKNVIVFCIDRFDALEYAEPALNSNRQMFSELEGFTYFEDHVSMYGHTFPAVAYMLTAKEYGAETRKDYFSSAFSDNETLSVLDSEGYSVNVYTDSYYGYYNAFYFPEYVDNTEIVSPETVGRKVRTPYQLALYMSQISFFRSFPFLLKTKLGDVATATLNGQVESYSEELQSKEYTTDMRNIYEKVSGEDFTTTTENVFSFIHMSGCHAVEYDDDFKPTRSKNVQIALRNSFKIINRYLKEMKRLGVYDDATIIITGDHASPQSDYAKLRKSAMTALFVKPAGVGSGELKTSKSQVSHENLWGTIFGSEGINASINSRSVFDVSETENVNRKHVWQSFNRTYSEYTDWVYEVNGKGSNFNSWKIKEEKVHFKNLYE